MADDRPRLGWAFRLTLGNHEHAGIFGQCLGIDSETQGKPYETVNARRRPFVQSEIRLKRGLDVNHRLWQWRDTVIKQGPDKARADGSISLVDQNGDPIVTYKFRHGWPVKYDAAGFNASSNEFPIEELVICHDGVTRE